MSALDNAGGTITDDGRITNNSVNVIFTATNATWVRSITVTDRAGGAPTCIIEKYDGTNTYRLRAAIALPTGLQVVYNEPFLLPLGWTIRITSGNVGGDIDWSITYDGPPAGKSR